MLANFIFTSKWARVLIVKGFRHHFKDFFSELKKTRFFAMRSQSLTDITRPYQTLHLLYYASEWDTLPYFQIFWTPNEPCFQKFEKFANLSQKITIYSNKYKPPFFLYFNFTHNFKTGLFMVIFYKPKQQSDSFKEKNLGFIEKWRCSHARSSVASQPGRRRSAACQQVKVPWRRRSVESIADRKCPVESTMCFRWPTSISRGFRVTPH